MAIRVSSRTWSGQWTGVVALVLLVSAIAGASAAAGPNDTSANPNAPDVRCAWVLLGATTPTGFTYQADDRRPADAATPSCSYDASRAAVAQSSDVRPALHVAFPNGASREVEVWAAVSSPASDAFGAGVGSVRWEVSNAAGVVVGDVPATQWGCGGTDAPGDMWRWASTTGATLSPDAVTNADRHGLWQLCRQASVRVVSTRFSLPASWPCGLYRFTAVANDGAATTRRSLMVDAICPASVMLDTRAIAWQVEPGASNTVAGDLDPATSNAPTITNLGGRAARIGILLQPLVGVLNGGVIGSFSVALSTSRGATSGNPAVQAGEELLIDPAQLVLCPGESASLTIAVHAPATAPRGEYRGTLSVDAHDGGSC